MASTDPVNGSSAAALAGLSGPSAAKKDDGTDRFLKLLVTQMRNQDPLNPMDNAQVTSQLAQINTVTGIERLNESIKGMSGQMFQSQALQGASLIGRNGFEWTVPAGASTDGLTFRVIAKSGAAELTATPLMTDRVYAVTTDGGSLELELARSGTTPYGLIKSIS